MKPPRVSVVMAVGPDLRFLDEAVGSVLTQGFSDLELVLVDDATGRGEVFAEIAGRDPRVRVLTNEHNVGVATSANRGIAAARGEIIARLDADDVAEPEHVGRLVTALDADPGLGLVGSSVTLLDEDGRTLGVRADARDRPRDPVDDPVPQPVLPLRGRLSQGAVRPGRRLRRRTS